MTANGENDRDGAEFLKRLQKDLEVDRFPPSTTR